MKGSTVVAAAAAAAAVGVLDSSLDDAKDSRGKQAFIVNNDKLLFTRFLLVRTDSLVFELMTLL